MDDHAELGAVCAVRACHRLASSGPGSPHLDASAAEGSVLGAVRGLCPGIRPGALNTQEAARRSTCRSM